MWTSPVKYLHVQMRASVKKNQQKRGLAIRRCRVRVSLSPTAAIDYSHRQAGLTHCGQATVGKQYISAAAKGNLCSAVRKVPGISGVSPAMRGSKA